ncbi:MAG: FAD-dependent oxidoreductase [Bacteroidota bacterium]|nr:FAD-dependent oxidoreductase [Bacteroidota bacterium]
MIKRRSFIKNTLLAGLGTSLVKQPTFPSSTLTEENNLKMLPTPKGGQAKKIIVGGAGISGLCCAYELMKQGHDVVVLEASGRHGGHVFTGRDGLSDGLYADFGADHITKPGYEHFFEYTKEFDLDVLEYPNAEGSPNPKEKNSLKMIGGKFYTEEMLADPAVLNGFGFNHQEIQFLSTHPWYELESFFLNSYPDKFKDPYQPFGVGYDDLDNIPIADLYKKEGASAAALNYLGGKHTSALYALWRIAVMKFRGIPLSEGETFRLKGGNQQLPNAFAKRLGDRVKLAHPVTAIKQDESGVTVSYKAFGLDDEMEMKADYFVNCISLQIFKNIPVTPALSPEKQFVADNMAYTSHPFYVFEAASKFWLKDGFKSINMEFEHPDISSIWQEPNEVDTSRVILKAYGPGGLSPLRVLAAFREVYPGKHDTIVQALTFDWTKDKFAPTCEMLPFPIGQMHKFWPEIMKPDGRIYFAGTYADNLSRGMESSLRSAQRVAKEIDEK